MSKEFVKGYNRTKPYGFTGKNGYDDNDEFTPVINKRKERQQSKVDVRREVEKYYQGEVEEDEEEEFGLE